MLNELSQIFLTFLYKNMTVSVVIIAVLLASLAFARRVLRAAPRGRLAATTSGQRDHRHDRGAGTCARSHELRAHHLVLGRHGGLQRPAGACRRGYGRDQRFPGAPHLEEAR